VPLIGDRGIISPGNVEPREVVMSSIGRTEARKIHDRLKHPIVDADGHWAEFPPLMREEFRTVVEKQTAEVLAQGR
jgi:hypothetical protein